MARIEVIGEWFFPQEVRVGGLIIPAQEAAVGKYQQLKEQWPESLPKLSQEVPMVSLAPGEKDNQPGYFVRTEVMYAYVHKLHF